MKATKLNITPEMHAFLKDRADMPRQQLTAELNSEFETSLTYEQVRAYCKRKKIMSGRNGKFVPGQTSWNKGFKSGGGPAHTLFQKGRKPHTWKPIGNVRLTKDGYYQIKVFDTGNTVSDYVECHRLVWQLHNGPIPPNHIVIFLDGDPSNIEIDNLKLIHRGANAIINKKRFRNLPAQLIPSGIAIGELMHKSGLRSKS